MISHHAACRVYALRMLPESALPPLSERRRFTSSAIAEELNRDGAGGILKQIELGECHAD